MYKTLTKTELRINDSNMGDSDFRTLYLSYPIKMGCGSSSDTVQTINPNASAQYNGIGHNQQQKTVAGYNQQQQQSGQQNQQQQYGQYQQQPGQPYQQQQHGQQPYEHQNKKQNNTQVVGLTLEQVEQETEEETRTRLSKYGKFKESYSMLDIIALRKKNGFFELFWWKDSVIHGIAFKDLVRQEVETMQQEQEYLSSDERLDFDSQWELHPVPIVNWAGFPMSKIVKYLPKCKVSKLSKLPNKEFWGNIKTDADQVAEDLRRDRELSVYQTEYLELLQRFFDRYVELCSEQIGGDSIQVGDPNELNFPLPKAVDPESIRNWATCWEEFDSEVPEGGAWGFPIPLNQVFSPGEATEYIPWYDPEAPEMDMEISREAGWEVIEVDLFKNDITTSEQDEIWASREQRTDMHDENRMKRRREQIANYMTEKYEWPPSKVEPFLSFTNTLEQGWNKFQELC